MVLRTKGVIAMLAATVCLASGASGAGLTWTPDGKGLLTIPNEADGRWEAASAAGRDGVRNCAGTDPQSLYLYFKLPESRREKGSLWVSVDCYEAAWGVGSLQAQTVTNAYTPIGAWVSTGSRTWRTQILKVQDADFSGGENCGASLRLMLPAGVIVGALSISDSAPVRAASPAPRLNTPARGMQYTIGFDPDSVTAPVVRALGATSVESYVTWETVEGKGKDQWDWSRWDSVVALLQANKLKWVPFLILSPSYSVPEWFKKSDQHAGCVCLEHGITSPVQSLWNPNLKPWVERFLSAFATRYGKTGVIESVLLGIQGDFGEAIYSVWGGGWTGNYHQHAGFWCNDPYALADFRAKMRERYGEVKRLNAAWGAGYVSFQEIDFPARGEAELHRFREGLATGAAGDRRRWLDFLGWYRQSMTDWAAWWMKTTRKYFPADRIYLCTGGDATPEHGSDFGQQCKVSAAVHGGVRITNEASNYADNFALTRWVASAGKLYGAYYGFEPAGQEDAKGVVNRIYGATASGCAQLHDYAPNLLASGASVEAQQKHISFLRKTEPRVDIAVFYPAVSLSLKWQNFLSTVSRLRGWMDFDFVDEGMLRDGALKRYRMLLIPEGQWFEKSDIALIRKWVEGGGIAVANAALSPETVEGDARPWQDLFGGVGAGRACGRGRVLCVPAAAGDYGGFANAALREAAAAGIPVAAGPQGVYCTFTRSGGALLLNTAGSAGEVLLTWPGRPSRKVTVPPDTIVKVDRI